MIIQVNIYVHNDREHCIIYNIQVLSKFNTNTKVEFEKDGEQGNEWKEANISIYLFNRMEVKHYL